MLVKPWIGSPFVLSPPPRPRRLVPFLCIVVNQTIPHLVDHRRARLSLKLERGLDDRDLGRGRVQSSKRTPIIHDQAGADHFGTTVDRSRHERYLKQRRQLILL